MPRLEPLTGSNREKMQKIVDRTNEYGNEQYRWCTYTIIGQCRSSGWGIANEVRCEYGSRTVGFAVHQPGNDQSLVWIERTLDDDELTLSIVGSFLGVTPYIYIGKGVTPSGEEDAYGVESSPAEGHLRERGLPNLDLRLPLPVVVKGTTELGYAQLRKDRRGRVPYLHFQLYRLRCGGPHIHEGTALGKLVYNRSSVSELMVKGVAV